MKKPMPSKKLDKQVEAYRDLLLSRIEPASVEEVEINRQHSIAGMEQDERFRSVCIRKGGACICKSLEGFQESAARLSILTKAANDFYYGRRAGIREAVAAYREDLLRRNEAIRNYSRNSSTFSKTTSY